MVTDSAFGKLAAVTVAFGLLAGCSQTFKMSRASADDRQSAADFALKDRNGDLIKLSDYKGKVVLLNFWATWCGPCKVEIPWFVQFERIYHDRGFEVLGISVDDDGWNAVVPFVAERGVNYPIVLANERVSNLYGGVDSFPTTFLIDREGRIASTHHGLVGKPDYEAEILRLISQ
jgi:cytochrome c biogenesis protein CcmG/thiol:disulfide interchange protein DsbE